MSVKELKEILSDYPDNMEVAIDIDWAEDVLWVVDYVSPDYTKCYLIIGNTEGFQYKQ